ncbi:50S ribosomal protein L27 [Candidatus Peribacteria bacterium]|nr:50S ribosomal protein L27 [Candidatus Peribacteria bacterium]
MAHKKAGGSTSNGRDSRAKRRGVKRFGGERVNAGEILIRQKGYWYFPGKNTHLGKDWTIHANIGGVVKFAQKRRLKFNGSRDRCTMVFVEPVAATK